MAMTSECPESGELNAFRIGAVDGAAFNRIAIHLERGCPTCDAALLAGDAATGAVNGIAPMPRLDPGTVLAGRYKLVETIGEGGMGTVYMAQQIAPVRRTVAIKLIRPGMDSAGVLARFEAERQALALMDH